METVVLEYLPAALPTLEAAMLSALEGGADRVVLDLDKLASLDADGVRGLIALLRRSRAQGAEVVLRATRPAVVRTLEVTALDRIFSVIDGEAVA